MEISHIEHIGIAVPSLDEAIPFYENMLGLKCFAIEEVADQKVRTAFFRIGQTKIELLEGTSEDSAISKFIANNGGRGGIQHVALNITDGVANALKINAGLRSAAFTFLGKCVNRRVARLLGIRAVDINLFLQFS